MAILSRQQKFMKLNYCGEMSRKHVKGKHKAADGKKIYESQNIQECWQC